MTEPQYSAEHLDVGEHYCQTLSSRVIPKALAWKSPGSLAKNGIQIGHQTTNLPTKGHFMGVLDNFNNI